ncbi:MAG: hypothetical protein NT062_33030 [Proteobacteria bacterium]|nr:hypothetical protein [Pseudomonadota bacterium]
MKFLIITLLVAGCTGETGGERIAFDASVHAAAPTLAYDDPTTGWHVELTTARVVVGPIYLWSQRPIDQEDRGFLRGEIVEQAAIDLVASAGATVPLASGDGLAGEALSGELWLAPPKTGYSFDLAGTATKGATTVAFHGGLTIDDTVIDESRGATAFEKRRVRAIPIDAQITDGGTLTIHCDARRWLTGAVFEDLAPDGAIAPHDPIWNQWFYQVRQSTIGPWSLSWSTP